MSREGEGRDKVGAGERGWREDRGIITEIWEGGKVRDAGWLG